MKTFVFTDIHGEFDTFLDLYQKIKIDESKDKLIFLGDYIDRGNKSFELIEFLISLKSVYEDRIIFLKGNHEDMMLKYLYHLNILNNYREFHHDHNIWFSNGGFQTIKSYNKNGFDLSKNEMPETHRKFYDDLDLYHETEDFIFVHAGLNKNFDLIDQDENDLMWIRNKFISDSFDFGKTIVFGHTVRKDFTVYKDDFKIGIDTGLVYGGKLTCLELPKLNFHKKW